MSNKRQLTPLHSAAQLERPGWLGAPPIRATNKPQDRDNLFRRFSHVIRKRDHIETVYVEDLTEHCSEILWLRGMKAAVTQRAWADYVQETIDKRVHAARQERGKLRSDVKAALDERIKTLTGKPDEIKSETEWLAAEAQRNLKSQIAALERRTQEEIAKWKAAVPTEQDLVGLFDRWAPILASRDDLEVQAQKKFDSTLKKIEDYRGGFGKLIAREIIDAEFKPV